MDDIQIKNKLITAVSKFITSITDERSIDKVVIKSEMILHQIAKILKPLKVIRITPFDEEELENDFKRKVNKVLLNIV